MNKQKTLSLSFSPSCSDILLQALYVRDVLRDKDHTPHPAGQAVSDLIAEMDLRLEVEKQVMLHECLHQVTDLDLDGHRSLRQVHVIHIPTERQGRKGGGG